MIPYLIATRHAVKVTNFSFQTMQDFDLSIQKYFGIGELKYEKEIILIVDWF